MPFIAPIVEGDGEVQALPILLRRIAEHSVPTQYLQINPPIRVRSGSFLNDEQYFTRYVGMAAMKAAYQNGTVLILLDCDDDCPATLGPALLARARRVRGDVRFLVVLAHREFESWFIAAIRSLAGEYGISNKVVPPENIETIRNAKGWLGRQMQTGYDPITHQYRFASRFDLAQAQASPSFSRLCRCIAQITPR